ncbi:phospho-N-acetylmuramoyl-pentapeptide-transferase [Leucobacter sp. OH2974_COT-288]|uniref:Phospho-N-acetylmuramoyl-pentapeptide-transferase n=1 Tax=Canibacter oris TaxID=1365628 RepID=A0A840DP27_9MICO|nr:phospho-N-acetylmuramoyl-pentapeptide-transferase [Canibacter oris]MBB4071299.1 phospho-N-acetylmuramoyl-pentapeptide-transferase [Canibacter oris]RRD36045.1 phospho-N-acetylmuramoyl-pentapeptide-transferase [Leucobacter sp. OH2974_COT-288]
MIEVVVAGIIALAFSLFLTPLFVRGFVRLEWGQFIREDGPKTHYAKRGTPTMGGLVFLLATVVAYFGAKLFTGGSITASAMLVFLLSLGCGLVGFIDDFLKTRKQQSLGLGGWAKIAGQVAVAVGFGLLAINFANEHGITPASTAISLFRDTNIDFLRLGVVAGTILFLAWIILITTATSNAVNLTDGLDGLAGGASILVFLAYCVISFWQFSQNCLDPSSGAACYVARDPLDLAVVAAAFAGSLIGFLWWNTSPALLYMGDTGSMGIGGAVAAFAILTRTELLLIFIGGLFLIEAGSVILQRVYFKVTKGRRIFLMSPIHHHFELKGWQEITVVVRFWIVSGALVIIGIALFYAEWVLTNAHP